MLYLTKMDMYRNLPVGFQREVVNRCFVNTSRAAEALRLHELIDDGVNSQTLTQLLASGLPKIMPHVLINKREVSEQGLIDEKVIVVVYICIAPDF